MGEIMLSVVVPVYNENNIDLCAERIMSVLEKANILYEIVFVDDGSENGVWNEINNLTIKNKNIRAVALSRNFGKENAICAGIDVSAGDCVVCIDADMQHPPEMIPQMYEMWQNGYEVVEGVKRCRCEGHKIYDIFARTFYYILKKLAHIDLQNSSDFRLLDRYAVEAWQSMHERQVFFRGMSSWIGFKHTKVYFDVEERKFGKSKWTKSKLITLAVSAFTSYSTLPLYISLICGMILSLCFAADLLGIVYMKFSGQVLDVYDIIISLQLLIGGMVTTGIGIMGLYVEKIYTEVKGRPRYIIRRIIGGNRRDGV